MPTTTRGRVKRRFFLAVSLLWTAGAIALIRPVADSDTWWIYLIYGLGLAAIPMQLVARIWEKRWILNPRHQRRGLLFRENVLLPIAIMSLMTLAFKTNADHSQAWEDQWAAIAMVAAFGVSSIYRDVQGAKYQPTTFYSATKTFHDSFASFGLTFVIVKYLPALWFGFDTDPVLVLGAITAIAGWIFLTLTDSDTNKSLEPYWKQDWDRPYRIGGFTHPGRWHSEIYKADPAQP